MKGKFCLATLHYKGFIQINKNLLILMFLDLIDLTWNDTYCFSNKLSKTELFS